MNFLLLIVIYLRNKYIFVRFGGDRLRKGKPYSAGDVLVAILTVLTGGLSLS